MSGLSADGFPRRIVCLTEETTETLYRLGQEDRIVGISGYTVRPARARQDKPTVSAYLSARTDRILDLEPDLVLAFSDLQADIVRDLTREGLQVLVFNQRSIAEILGMVRLLGRLVGVPERGEALAKELEANLERTRAAVPDDRPRPRVYFEEWDEPMISGIRWVSELVEIAGGRDCFPELAGSAAAKGRVIEDPAVVVERSPDIVFGSWCGKKFHPERVASREGWKEIPAVREGRLYEIDSSEILQPGPAALTDGLARIHERIEQWHREAGEEAERG